MQERFACSPTEVKTMTTEQLRETFLLGGLFEADRVELVYSHYDRMVVGGVLPLSQPVILQTYEPLKSDFFLQRREMGIINVGSEGTVAADGTDHQLSKLDCLYLGRGTKEISFRSADPAAPAQFFLLSAPAHQTYPSRLMKSSEATPAHLGSQETANERTIYKYIHEEGIKSCQLVMGLTVLKGGSVWNTMPAHTHNRRMEVYLYFDVKEEHRVIHLMGEPTQTRHLVVGNREAVLSAPWSIHSGCGTSNYAFIWGMAGENQAFADMDAVAIKDLV
ncbi:MAG: 5-dehydro-4-deoxy-D-glucuronate isomerase [Bacteroidota bacterium]|nr:5-dehydro-4-deoxy-D-glucuronate isomerase [Bacteroidota bacterium]